MSASPERDPAAKIAAQRVTEVRDRPQGRLELLRSSYAPPPGAPPRYSFRIHARPSRSWAGSCDADSPTRSITSVRAGELVDYIADEHTLGRLLDVGVIVPRLTELYRWSAGELRIPDGADLVDEATPTYAWDPNDREPWSPPPTRLVRMARWALPSPPRAPGYSQQR